MILQIDDDKVIKKWTLLSDISKYTGYDEKDISNAIKERKSYNGYYWIQK